MEICIQILGVWNKIKKQSKLLGTFEIKNLKKLEIKKIFKKINKEHTFKN